MSWFGDIFNDIGHGASSAWHGASDFVNRTPLKAVFAIPNLASDIVHGKNVFDSVGHRALDVATGATPVWSTALVQSEFSKTKVGQGVGSVVDKFTGGFASRTFEASNLATKNNFDSPLNKKESTTFVKDVGVNAAEAGAVYATAGAAHGVFAGLGVTGSAAGAGSAFAALKAGSAVGEGVAKGNFFEAASGASSALSGFGNVAGFDVAKNFFDSVSGGAPSAPDSGPVGPVMSVNDPIGLGMGAAPGPETLKPPTDYSALTLLAAVVAGSYYMARSA